MSLRSPLGRVRGLGASRHGTQHFLQQRFTAILLVPLVLWFVASLLLTNPADHGEVVRWMRSPLNAVLLLLLIGNVFHHGQLGIQVVFEDYIGSEWQKVTAIILLRMISLLAFVAATICVLRVFLGY